MKLGIEEKSTSIPEYQMEKMFEPIMATVDLQKISFSLKDDDAVIPFLSFCR
ncbi:MAG: hypothetical protein ACYSWS_00165 [Planctomycetota bacterium]|jgi:hypothetical protein